MNINKEVRRWNKYNGLYRGYEQDGNISEEDRVAYRNIYDEIQSFQGRIVVKSRANGGVCEHCGRNVASVAVHVSHANKDDWNVHNSWDNLRVVCRSCRGKVIGSRN